MSALGAAVKDVMTQNLLFEFRENFSQIRRLVTQFCVHNQKTNGTIIIEKTKLNLYCRNYISISINSIYADNAMVHSIHAKLS